MKFATSALVTAALFAVPTLSAPVKAGVAVEKRGLLGGQIMYDDYPGPGVTYTGNWVHLTNQGEDHRNGTGTYTGQQNAEVRFDLPANFGSITGVTIQSTKKHDRGNASVYCGKSLVGVFSEYADSTGETNSEVVFSDNVSSCSLPDGGAPYIVVKNDQGAQYLAIDAIEIGYSGQGYYDPSTPKN